MFRTELSLDPSPHKITLKDSVLTIGSCFSNHIGDKLSHNKIQSLVNPFGTVYNPVSLFKLLTYSSLNQSPPEETFVKQNGIYYNLDFHSEISSLELSALKQLVDDRIQQTQAFLKNVNWIIITFGTAYTFNYKDTGNIVNNCHKIPSGSFEKKLLSPAHIVKAYELLYQVLSKINTGLNVIFTISPVRHIKETLEGNALSKAILRVAIQQILEKFPQHDYFPSYEIMMDDLRDYRFYNEDMIHPNKVAVDYIWEKFTHRYLDDNALRFLKEWNKIVKAINHKPFHPDAPSHQDFLRKTIERLIHLNEHVDVSKELEFLKRQII